MDWLENYKASHQNRWNRLCHSVGIPLIVISLPVVLFSWRIALALFVLGWVFQILGHVFEGKPPAFFANPRYLLVGPWWWFSKFFNKRA